MPPALDAWSDASSSVVDTARSTASKGSKGSKGSSLPLISARSGASAGSEPPPPPGPGTLAAPSFGTLPLAPGEVPRPPADRASDLPDDLLYDVHSFNVRPELDLRDWAPLVDDNALRKIARVNGGVLTSLKLGGLANTTEPRACI